MRYLCAALACLALAACDTYAPPPPPPAYTSTTAPSTAVVPAAPACVYTSRSYAAGTRINPPELPGTTLQCVNGSWHSI